MRISDWSSDVCSSDLESMHETERVFGQLYIDTGSEDVQTELDALNENLDAAGIEVVEQIGYALDPGSLAEQAATAIARLKSAGVTSVIIGGDPIAPKIGRAHV